ncbi:MAG: hypothetical protein PVI38_20730 [Desulfobacterales bacterium]
MKKVDYARGQDENDSAEPFGRELRAERLVAGRFKSGAYTLVFEYFESIFNTAIGHKMHF